MFSNMHAPRQPHPVANNCLSPFSFLFLSFFFVSFIFFCFFGNVVFSEYFCTITVLSLNGESSHVFPFRVCFIRYDYGLVFLHQLIIIIINDTLARSLEPVVTECKEHTINTQTQIVASRKPKEIKHTHEGEANFT